MVKRKESMTSLDIAATIKALESRLIGSRLANIYEIEKNMLLFKFKSPKIETKLVVEPAKRIHATGYEVTEKQMPNPFVMGLRKYLRGARLEKISQIGFDRIVVLEFANGYKLYIELIPRGVIALVDKNNIILQVSEQKKLKDRVIKVKEKYAFPPLKSLHPEQLTPEKLYEDYRSSNEVNIVRFIVKQYGMPPELVEEAVSRSGIGKEAVGREDIEKLVAEIKNIYREALQGKGYIVQDELGMPITVLPYKPYSLKTYNGHRLVKYEDFNTALDEYFKRILEAVFIEKAVKEYEAEKAKLLESLRRAEENVEDLNSKITKLKEIAEIVSSNISKLYEVHECVERIKNNYGWDYIPGNCPGVIDVEPDKGIVKVSIGDIIVDYDVRLDPSRFVISLYKRIGELEKKKERTLKAIKELKEKIERVNVEIRRKTTRAKASIVRREWYEKYHWMYTSNWFLVIGGRDASQNESIVKKFLEDDDIFLHANIQGAPAVILFTKGKQVSGQDIREAAVLAACYSKAWKLGMGAVEVYWVYGKQVSKSPPSGEYIKKGAFMIYGKRNYVGAIELKLALGISVEKEHPIVIIGPDYLVRKRSHVYAVLAPGDEDPSKIAKRLRSLFTSKVDDNIRDVIASISVEEIRLRLPGRSRILAIARGAAVEPPRPTKKSQGA